MRRRPYRSCATRTKDNDLARSIDSLISLQEMQKHAEEMQNQSHAGSSADLLHLINNTKKEADKCVEEMAKHVTTLLYPTPPMNGNLEVMKALNALIDDHFGIYMSNPGDCAYITFLPEDKLIEAIPVEYMPKLNEQLKVFTEKIDKFSEELGTLEDIDDNLPEEKQEEILKVRMKLLFKEYKKVFGESLKIELKRTFGIRTDPSPIRKTSYSADSQSFRKNLLDHIMEGGTFKALP